MEKRPEIFCFINGEGFGGVIVAALAEDGTVICSHASSNEGWAKHDIGIGSDVKHEYYKAKYPDGYNLIWLDRKQLDSHAGFQNAIKLNESLAPSDLKV